MVSAFSVVSFRTTVTFEKSPANWFLGALVLLLTDTNNNVIKTPPAIMEYNTGDDSLL